MPLASSIQVWCPAVVKGEMRLVTHAFVKPGRDLFRATFEVCERCVDGEVLTVHGSIERVPVGVEIDGGRARMRLVREELRSTHATWRVMLGSVCECAIVEYKHG